MIEGSNLFLGMFNNLAIFIVFVSIYSFVKPIHFQNRWLEPVVMGTLFGVALLVCMQVKIPVAEGVLVDQRNAIVVLSTFFCGPAAGLITYLIGVIMRSVLGGIGVLAGIIGLTLSYGVGNLLRLWPGRRHPLFFIVGSFIATVVILPGFLFVGDFSNGWQLMKKMALPYGTAIYLGMLFVGFLLQHESNRIVTASKLKESEKRYRNLYEKLIDISFSMDNQGCIREISPSVEHILGYAPEDVLGSSFFDYLENPDEKESFLDEMKKEGSLRDTEIYLKKKNQSSACVSVNSDLEYDTNGTPVGIYGIIRDITRLREVQKEQSRLEKMVIQNQKMDSLGTLAGGIAHDFNNILGAILGFSELLRERFSDDSENATYIDEILKAADRAKKLVKQILLFSRNTNPEMKVMDLSSVVKEALGLLTQTIPKTVAIRYSDSCLDSWIRGDENQLHQVIINLITNAFHALKQEDGTIDITLSKFSLDSPGTGEFRNVPAGNYLSLQVKDNGRGIPEENRERVFDPFFTTKERGKGTGLGLAVVHGIIEKHGGIIQFTSEIDKGTCFTVLLPELEKREVHPANENEQQEPDPFKDAGGGERILIVDDEKPIINLEKRMLESLGYQVRSFTDPLAALDAFKADTEAFQLLLTDQSMPGISGLKLAELVLKESPGFPIVIASGYSSNLNQESAEKLGVKRVIVKPFSKKDVATAIRESLDN